MDSFRVQRNREAALLNFEEKAPPFTDYPSA